MRLKNTAARIYGLGGVILYPGKVVEVDDSLARHRIVEILIAKGELEIEGEKTETKQPAPRKTRKKAGEDNAKTAAEQSDGVTDDPAPRA
jgi:hypothetical protein